MSPTPSSPDCPRSWLGDRHERNERRTLWVVGLTVVMMVGEIVGGAVYGSMALVADGWHMATHAAALAIAAAAYRFARSHAADPRFSFGTGKVGELAGFASAVTLAIVAALIAWESVQRLIDPRPIGFLQAGAIAVLGLAVNLVSAVLLHDEHEHDDHDQGHAGHHRDTNLHAAYVHVLADALTSVLAIAGLLAGRYLGWWWMDPLIGIAGAVLISHWAIGLMRTAGASLIDAHDTRKLEAQIRARLEQDGRAQVTDLHLWRLGPGHNALMASVTTDVPAPPAAFKSRLDGVPTLSHVTIEVNPRS
jgi:cation diffusion facilitator family transporter